MLSDLPEILLLIFVLTIVGSCSMYSAGRVDAKINKLITQEMER